MESPVERALLRASSSQPMPRPHLRQVPPGGYVVFSAGATERPSRATITSGVDKVGADHAIIRPRS